MATRYNIAKLTDEQVHAALLEASTHTRRGVEISQEAVRRLAALVEEALSSRTGEQTETPTPEEADIPARVVIEEAGHGWDEEAGQ